MDDDDDDRCAGCRAIVMGMINGHRVTFPSDFHLHDAPAHATRREMKVTGNHSVVDPRASHEMLP